MTTEFNLFFFRPMGIGPGAIERQCDERAFGQFSIVEKKRPNLRPLGANLRRLRVERGLSQEALDGLAGLHTNHIGGVERGERNLTIATLFKLAEALKVSPADLLMGYDRDDQLWAN